MCIESIGRAGTSARRLALGIRKLGLAGMAAACCAVLALPERAGAEDARGADTCITVELIMYSGRPRPRYQICDGKEKREVLAKAAAVQEQKPSATPVPDMESTPAYQGILLTLPGQPGTNRRLILVRKGFLQGMNGDARKDKGRSLEKFFLERSLREQDLAEPPGKDAPIGRVSEAILDQVSREPAE